jgi:hypothetical protein
MYIIVRHSDNIIIGSAVRPVDQESASQNGYKIFQIDDSEFTVEMIGSKLDSFDEVK